ncbi:MAG: hypothetical protein ACP5GS_06045 [Nitrososphaeria archaeon]
MSLNEYDDVSKKYSLRWNPKRKLNPLVPVLSLSAFIIDFALVYLNRYIFVEGKVGTAIFFILFPFVIEFVTIWGIWGIVASYAGISAGLFYASRLKPLYALFLSFVYLVPALISFVVYRGVLKKFGVDPLRRDLLSLDIDGEKAKRLYAWIAFLIINDVLLNLIEVFSGLYFLNIIGYFTKDEVIFWFYVWSFSNFISDIIIEPILIKTMTESLEELGLVNLGWVT